MSRKIKLVRGQSYTGHGVTATKQKPEVTVDEAAAEKLVASGFFEAVAEEPKGSEEAAETAVENMTLAQLKAVASEKGITATGLRSKADYIAAIKAAVQE